MILTDYFSTGNDTIEKEMFHPSEDKDQDFGDTSGENQRPSNLENHVQCKIGADRYNDTEKDPELLF